jgi:hypothetical protein
MISTAGHQLSSSRDPPPRRVILLGASNLTKAISTVVESSCGLWGRPLDVLAAFGHGRSYGLRKTFLGRELPPILRCGLWQALEQRPPAPTAALLTDIGNDLLYEVPVAQIAGWIERCVERLQQAQARVVMTLLPVCNIEAVSPAQYSLMRSLWFPRCRLRFRAVVDRTLDLDQRLRDLGRRRNLLIAEQRPEWYGYDPFHIRMGHWSRAWPEILSAWSDPPVSPAAPAPSLWRWLQLRSLAPERRWLFGVEQRKAQPAGLLPDGTTVAFY